MAYSLTIYCRICKLVRETLLNVLQAGYLTNYLLKNISAPYSDLKYLENRDEMLI
jgi:hypothetical protein